jgi:CelD/BcsL family acetyltransferase involved in cellulose biosynthesis
MGASTVTRLASVPFDGLTGEQLDAWHRLRSANPALDSPYFHPGFAAAVHASGAPVEVVVGYSQDRICALLACHRDRSLLRPAGWPAADFQGPVLAPGTAFPPRLLLSGGVRGFAFDHLLSTYGDFEPFVESSRSSPFIDTTGGMDGYLGRASRTGKDNMGQARRRTARAERELGTVRFEADIVDQSALQRVIAMKRSQYASTGARDYFADPRRAALLDRLMHARDPEFAGMLSTVYAGPHLLAAHFGIRSGPVLHWWFPVFDSTFANLSPGWILLRELVTAAPTFGIGRIDLGRGDDEYKRRAKTGEVLVSQGVVQRSTPRRALRRAGTSLVAHAKTSPLGPGLRRAVRRLRSLDQGR